MMMMPTAKRWTDYFSTSSRNRSVAFRRLRPSFLEVPNDILDHQDSAIHNQAKINGAQAHEISGNAAVKHRRKSY